MPTPRTYDDYVSEYESFDMPALLAETVTLEDKGPLTQLMALGNSVLELLAYQELSPDHQLAGIRLATATRNHMEAFLEPMPDRMENYLSARDATYNRLFKRGRFPEVVRLAMPENWEPTYP